MNIGSYIEIETKNGDFLKGVVMQSSDPNVLSLKLDSGYNVGLERKNIKKTKELKKEKQKVVKHKEEVKFDNNLKTITILHTGGTVASRVDYNSGAVSPSFTPQDILSMFPELKTIANIKSRLISNMWSGDMRFSHYNLMAKEIEKELKSGVDGIIVTHGTDTLAFSACAMAFALENLDKPVIFVGSQRSSDRPSSDAAINLLCAAYFITKTNFSDVAICMHSKSGDEYCDILPACKTKKLHTSRRDAFKVVNGNLIARVNKNGNVEFLQTYSKKEHKEKLNLRLFNKNLKIGVLKAHPSMWKEEIRNYSKFNGLVIEGTGLGHLNVDKIDNETLENELVYNEIKKLAKKIPLVMVSQCVFGRVNMNVYQYGRKLQQAGVLGNMLDMTLETAFIKLNWLLSNYKKRNEVEELFVKNLRGEISSRVIYEEEFV